MKKYQNGEEKIKKRVRFQTQEVEEFGNILKEMKIENVQDSDLTPESDPIQSIVIELLHEKDLWIKLNKAIELVDRSDKKENAKDSLLWESLMKNTIHPKSFVAILGGLIDHNQSDVSFIASVIYLNLLILRGSEVYSIFNPVTLNSIYELIKNWIYFNSRGMLYIYT